MGERRVSGPTALAIVRELLDGVRPYEEVARRVRERLPGARTTARSVATVACRLRSGGVGLPRG